MSDLSYDQMRSCVIDGLKQFALPQREPIQVKLNFESLRAWAAKVAEDRGLLERNINRRSGPFSQRSKEQFLCDQVIWELFSDGILYPTIGENRYGRLSWDEGDCRLSVRGVDWLRDNLVSLHDRYGFLRALGEACQEMETRETILAYAEEGMRAFHTRLYLASMVMVGAAAECALVEMIDTYRASRYPGPTETTKKAGEAILSKFDWFRKSFESNAVEKDIRDNRDLSDWLTVILSGTGVLLSTRNAAGHPERRSPGQEDAQASLTLLRPWLQRVSGLTAVFRAKLRAEA